MRHELNREAEAQLICDTVPNIFGHDASSLTFAAPAIEVFRLQHGEQSSACVPAALKKLEKTFCFRGSTRLQQLFLDWILKESQRVDIVASFIECQFLPYFLFCPDFVLLKKT
ncbi:hypothetical protein EVAR_100904_1 [Eumeta japonica]|uniref:Uncharacterized protein n=1 Tax=Eumeta variegata TaxID=151549 RepID=A0A4C1TAH0_EUMVA|nr:hypothetical protein EVAR_100904_1 [Eumeta japonica]